MILDVDFLPSANAYKNIQKYVDLLDGQGRNALVIPAFEVDADVLNHDSSAIDNVRYKRRLRELYMFDKRVRWQDTPRTRSKASISIDALQKMDTTQRKQKLGCTHRVHT